MVAAAGGEGGGTEKKKNDGALLSSPWLRARVRQRMRVREKERALGFSTSCTRGELASSAHAWRPRGSSKFKNSETAILPRKYA